MEKLGELLKDLEFRNTASLIMFYFCMCWKHTLYIFYYCFIIIIIIIFIIIIIIILFYYNYFYYWLIYYFISKILSYIQNYYRCDKLKLWIAKEFCFSFEILLFCWVLFFLLPFLRRWRCLVSRTDATNGQRSGAHCQQTRQREKRIDGTAGRGETEVRRSSFPFWRGIRE